MLGRRALLLALRPPAERRVATVGEGCLARAGITCAACRDICPVNAIRFRPALRRIPTPAVVTGSCTGCGECLHVCPVEALRLEAIRDG